MSINLPEYTPKNKKSPISSKEDFTEESTQETIRLAAEAVRQANKLLEDVSDKKGLNHSNIKHYISSIKNALDSIVELHSEKAEYIPFISFTGGTTNPIQHLSIQTNTPKRPLIGSGKIDKHYEEDDSKQRLLPGGGLSPPKRKPVTNIELDETEKNRLLREMREMQYNGATITKTKDKAPLNIPEFTLQFKYLEDMSEISPFIIALLKSQFEINEKASELDLTLVDESEKCLNGEVILLYMYDIIGSESAGEKKHFIIKLTFNQILGQLTYDGVIFRSKKPAKLSLRQIEELKNFFDLKKIAYENLK